VDVTAPSLELLAPRDETFTNERDLQVLWLASDAVSGIADLEVVFGAESKSPEGGLMVTFPDVPEGEETVRVIATDFAGNRAEVAADVTVDYTAPVLTITSPSAGAEVSGDLTITWTATDAVSGVARYELLYDGGLTPVDDETSFRVAEPREGAHVAVVRAWDQAGNMAERVVSFKYGVAGPIEPSGLPALEFWLLILVLGAIAVGSAYYAVRRRNRTKA
jgi:hypothetical protein